MFEITIKNSNDLHPNSSNDELKLSIKFDKADKKIVFRSVSSSFSDSLATKLLSSFVAKTAISQCKMLRKEVKLA